MTTTRVRLPDGSHVNVPTGDQAQAAAAAKRYWENKQKTGGGQAPRRQAPPRRTPPESPSLWSRYKSFADTAADAAGNAIDQVLPNWMDELYAAPRAVAAFAKGEDAGQAFRQAQAKYKRNQSSFAQNHPTVKAASTGTGVVGGLFLPAAKAVQGASMVQKARQGAALGAAWGTAAGAGKGDGLDLGNRATNAATDGTIGAVLGAAAPKLFDAMGSVGRMAREHVPGVDSVVRGVGRAVDRFTGQANEHATAGVQQARRMVGHHMTEGHMADGPRTVQRAATPERIAREVASRNELGVPAVVGDVTQDMRDLTSWSSRGLGPGQTMVRERLARRKEREASRVRQHVTDTFPTTNDPIRYVEEAKRETREAAAPLYAQAYAQPMYRTPPIQGIEETPAFQDALPQAYRNIRNQIDPETGRPSDPTAMGFRYFDGDPQGLPPNSPYFRLPDSGYVTYDQGLSTEGYDQVARAMSDTGRAASHVNPVTGRIESTTNSVHINERARDLRTHIRGQNPAYDQAVGRFGDDMSHINAFNMGTDVSKLTGHEVNAQMRQIPEAAQQSWTTGAGTALADEASNFGARFPNGNTAAHIRKALGDDTKQGAISEMSGNTGNVRQLQERLEFENQGNINWSEITGNSRTAQRQALDADMDKSLGAIPLSLSGIVSRVGGAIVSKVAPRYRNQVKEEVARIMTASNPQTVQEAIQAVTDQTLRDDRFANLLHQAGLTATTVTTKSLPEEGK